MAEGDPTGRTPDVHVGVPEPASRTLDRGRYGVGVPSLARQARDGEDILDIEADERRRGLAEFEWEMCHNTEGERPFDLAADNLDRIRRNGWRGHLI